jgi:ADP-ribose pyrophosphatase YjhB (NUDIX family)
MPASIDHRAWIGEAYAVADELRSVAGEGLEYARDEYDRRRYERVLHCSARLLTDIEQRPREAILEDYSGDLHQITPQIGVDAMVVERGRVLLIQRTDNRMWCMPGGAAEVGESLAQAAERELQEEAGIEGRATRVVALFDSRLWRSGVKRHMVHVVLLVERLSGTPTISTESLAVGYFGESELPPLSHGHRHWLPMLLARQRQGVAEVYFDASGAGAERGALLGGEGNGRR